MNLFPSELTWMNFITPREEGYVIDELNPIATVKDITLKVFPSWYEFCELSWIFPKQWEQVMFNVYKSGAEEGPFIKLTSSPIQENFFSDESVRYNSLFSVDFYKVEAVFPDGSRVHSLPFTWGLKQKKPVELRTREIQRRAWLLLRKRVGVQVFFFKKRNYGPRCSHCWDPSLEKCMEDHCPVCFGTSFEGGYWKPIKSLMQFDPTPNQVDLQDYGKTESNSGSGWTIAYPEVAPYDLIWKPDENKMFRIMQTQRTELQTIPVRQSLSFVELSKNMIEYKLKYVVKEVYQNE